ncbi:MAG: PAS domain S-box protein, partial [Methylomonas sp.]|nr:PAS domain S-box protein [Methylomonas sp.]
MSSSRQFLRSVIDTIADPVFVKNRQHRWILCNAAFCSLIGLPQEALLGKSDHDFFPNAEADKAWERDEALFHGGKEEVSEVIFTDRHGLNHHVVIKKKRYAGDDGDPMLVAIIQAVAERKQMEAEILERAEAFRTLAEHLPGIIVRYDASFRRIFFN